MSGGAGTLPTLVLETSTVGHEGPRETGETDGGGGKAGDQHNDEEDCSGWRRDPSTPVPETTLVFPECQHKTREMGGGREEAWPGVGIYERKEVAKTGEQVASGKEEEVGIRPDRKRTRSGMRLERKKIRLEFRPTRKKKGAEADRPGPTRKRANRTGTRSSQTDPDKD